MKSPRDDDTKRLEDATTNVSKQLVTEAKTNTKTAWFNPKIAV